MKKLRITTIILLLALQGWVNLHAQSTLALVESAGNCGLSTNCANNTICLDIMLTPGVTATLLSYNVWLNYENVTNLHYASDNACITQNGGDNNFDVIGHYRVAGASGTMPVTQGVPIAIHTICFTYVSILEINGDDLTVGGSLGSFNSTITYTNPPSSEPMLPAFPFELNPQTISCVALPVKWLSFDANRKGATSVLDWLTGEEFNNKGFEVLRSPNGQDFEKIGWVDAKENPTALNTYQFIDQHPYRGINYYRLKQIDLDGAADFSPVRKVVFNSQLFSVTVTPNPAREFFMLDILTEEASSDIKLIDITGRVVVSEKVDKDDVTTLLRIDKLGSGTYTLIVESGPDYYIEKVVIMD